MKVKILFLFMLLCMFVGNLPASDVTTVNAKDSSIGDNLDLEAVASVFGQAKDLEDFEKKLNDPKTKINNLDLNGDGKVDYLRVSDSSKGNTMELKLNKI